MQHPAPRRISGCVAGPALCQSVGRSWCRRARRPAPADWFVVVGWQIDRRLVGLCCVVSSRLLLYAHVPLTSIPVVRSLYDICTVFARIRITCSLLWRVLCITDDLCLHNACAVVTSKIKTTLTCSLTYVVQKSTVSVTPNTSSQRTTIACGKSAPVCGLKIVSG